MQIFTQLVFSGIALGMIYAVIAFGYQLTFATSDTLNFGQGEALMLGALVGLSLVGWGVATPTSCRASPFGSNFTSKNRQASHRRDFCRAGFTR